MVSKHPNIKRKVIVGHDWGALFTYYLDRDHPNTADHLITLDVSPDEKTDVLFVLLTMTYLIYQAMTFLVFETLGNFMMHLLLFFVFSRYNPSKYYKHEGVHSRMNYLYWNFVVKILHRAKRFWNIRYDFRNRYVPSCPVTYLYASDKLIQLHSQKWLEHLRARGDGSRSLGVGGGHWISLMHPDLMLSIVEQAARPEYGQETIRYG